MLVLLTQSKNQNDVFSIEAIFDGSDTVSYQYCSYFIDSWLTDIFTCDPCTTIIEGLGGLGGVVGCTAACVGAAALLDEIGIGEVIQAACPEICALLYEGQATLTAKAVCEKVDLC